MKIRKIILNCLNVCILGLVVLGFACQQKPTKVVESSAQVYKLSTVMIDTRSAVEYESFHFEGMQNLNSADFLILENQSLARANFLKDKIKNKRVLDHDLENIIDRLRKKGINPEVQVVLVGDKADSLENLKWQWLLHKLEIRDVQLKSLEQLRTELANKPNKFQIPEWVSAWSPRVLTNEKQRSEFYTQAKSCFENWVEKSCR